MFTLRIATDNAAFEGDAAGEVGRILRELSHKIDGTDIGAGKLRDVNGNTVGEYKYTSRTSRKGRA